MTTTSEARLTTPVDPETHAAIRELLGDPPPR